MLLLKFKPIDKFGWEVRDAISCIIAPIAVRIVNAWTRRVTRSAVSGANGGNFTTVQQNDAAQAFI